MQHLLFVLLVCCGLASGPDSTLHSQARAHVACMHAQAARYKAGDIKDQGRAVLQILLVERQDTSIVWNT